MDEKGGFLLIGGHTIRYVIIAVIIIAAVVYFAMRNRKK